MGYLSNDQLESLGFAFLGKNVKVSDRAAIHRPDLISIGDDSRIDDFCTVSGRVTIGKNIHLAVYAHISGGETGVTMLDFSGLAFGVHVFAESDDYSGESLTNPTVPRDFKNPICKPVMLEKHVIIGANSMVFPGVNIGEGTAVGSMTLVNRSLDPWGIYSGVPAKRIRERSKKLLELENEYLKAKPEGLS